MAQTGREERFETLFVATRARVAGYVLRRCAASGAPDVLADVYLIAWQRLEELPDGEAALPWLLVCARNVIANGARKEDRGRVALERLRSQLEHAIPGPDGEAMMARQALGQLSVADREILMLVTWDGLTVAELAETLGCSTTAARIRLHRARRRLGNAELHTNPTGEARPPGIPHAVTSREGFIGK